ncbi:MAG: non-homologous end-joining DNA ligase [Verrucomicrobiia bacterium]
MQCKLVHVLPEGSDWIYELKFDGFRALALKTGPTVRILSRNRRNLSSKFPEIVEAVRALPLQDGVIDGEIVALDAAGRPSFQDLQHAGRPGFTARPICFYAFDFLNREGEELTHLPLARRKGLLLRAIHGISDRVRFVEALEGKPKQIIAAICRFKLEGVVAKQIQSRYESNRRSGAWVKYKCGLEQEFVISGYTRGKGRNQPFGAAIVGYYDRGLFRYAGKVGSGFSGAEIRDLLRSCSDLVQMRCPFDHIPHSEGSSWSPGLTATELKSATWLRPEKVCRVRFIEWTRDGHLRHPCFEGLRLDKDAKDVVREG